MFSCFYPATELFPSSFHVAEPGNDRYSVYLTLLLFVNTTASVHIDTWSISQVSGKRRATSVFLGWEIMMTPMVTKLFKSKVYAIINIKCVHFVYTKHETRSFLRDVIFTRNSLSKWQCDSGIGYFQTYWQGKYCMVLNGKYV